MPADTLTSCVTRISVAMVLGMQNKHSDKEISNICVILVLRNDKNKYKYIFVFLKLISRQELNVMYAGNHCKVSKIAETPAIYYVLHLYIMETFKQGWLLRFTPHNGLRNWLHPLNTYDLPSARCQIISRHSDDHHRTPYKGLILGLRPDNERRRYFVTTPLIGWAQA